MVYGSAPGRICLVGEHNDWAGGAAVVVPLDREATAEVEDAAAWSAEATVEGESCRWEGGAPGKLFLVPAVLEALARRGVPLRPGHVVIRSEVPAGRGLSSSAAVGVALVRALTLRAGLSLGPAELAELAYVAERDVAGVACGRLDQLAAAHAVPLFLTFEGEQVQAEPLPARLDLAVGTLGAPRDTRRILSVLQQHHRGDVPLRDWDAIRRVGAVRGALEGFGAQARHARVALRDGDLAALGGAMDTCQEIYEEELMPALPDLAAPRLIRAVRSLRASGALGAKFSGAGGDGSVVGLFPPGGAVRDGVVALDALGVSAFAVELWCSV